VYHVPKLKPEMVEEPSSVKLSTRHRTCPERHS
jgi:hypothetical protein